MSGVSVRQWDPGLQPERTALAWRRTLLSLNTGVLVLALTAARVHRNAIVVAAGLILVASVVPMLASPTAGGMPQRKQLHSWPHLARIAFLVVALGLVGAAFALMVLLDSSDGS